MKTNTATNDLIRLTGATLRRGRRLLWQDLDIAVKPGEFIAVLGPNGAGKTTLLKVFLGLLPLTKGDVLVMGEPARKGDRRIGYIPQHKNFDPTLPIRGRDLVELGINGYRYGLSGNGRSLKTQVDEAIAMVDAGSYADRPIGLLSGGEQQRLRIAQALAGKPELLLCDEPLLSLDMASQRTITGLIDEYRTRSGAAVIFVTHEINPILQYVDRVLYMANGRWVIDTPKRVLQSKTLSNLYGTAVEVLRVKDRVIVLGAEDVALTEQGGHHGEHA